MEQNLAAIHFFLDRATDPSDLHDAFDGLSETLTDLAARLRVLEAARSGSLAAPPAANAVPDGGGAPIDLADRAALDALATRSSALDDRPLTEDAIVFGSENWVYCRQHQNAHRTGC